MELSGGVTIPGEQGDATRAPPLSSCVAPGKLPPGRLSVLIRGMGCGGHWILGGLCLHTLLQHPDICYILQGAWPLPSSLLGKGQDAAEQHPCPQHLALLPASASGPKPLLCPNTSVPFCAQGGVGGGVGCQEGRTGRGAAG